ETVAAAAVVVSASLLTSQRSASASVAQAATVFSAAARSTSRQATLAPAAVKARQMARPTPPPAPVTMDVLPASAGSLIRSLLFRPRRDRDRPPGRACLL